MKFKHNKYGKQLLRRKGKATVILKIGSFDNIDSAVIITSESKAARKVKNCLAYMLMMTAESMLSKRPVLIEKF